MISWKVIILANAIVDVIEQCLFFLRSGYKNDIFWGETYSKYEDGTERWCGSEEKPALLPEMSVDGFRQLRERSFLYSMKNQLPKYKLTAIDANLLASDVHVNYFYCEPTGADE
jgi:hypothetical protein